MSNVRHMARIENEIFYIEHGDDWLEVGEVSSIIELLGGETYTLEYTQEQASAAWLNTTADNSLEINIRETLESMSYREDFVANLVNCPLDETGSADFPKRTELYTELLTEILESKGNLRN